MQADRQTDRKTHVGHKHTETQKMKLASAKGSYEYLLRIEEGMIIIIITFSFIHKHLMTNDESAEEIQNRDRRQ